MLFVAMLLTARLAWSGHLAAAVALVLQAGVWLEVDSDFEGPHLISFSKHHGLVVADLVAVVAVATAVVAWRRRRRQPPLSKPQVGSAASSARGAVGAPMVLMMARSGWRRRRRL